MKGSRSSLHLVGLIALIGSLVEAQPSHAGLFGDIVRQVTGVEINIPRGEITIQPPQPQQLPQTITQAIQHAPEYAQDVARAVFNPAGQLFADALRHAEGQARFGAKPIPDQIRQDLAEFFPGDVLAWAEWNVQDSSRIDIPNQLLQLDDRVQAVTVGRYVVFRTQSDAETNSVRWAHELVHVLQYRQMGIDAFAHAYMLSGGSDLERPAYDYEAEVARRLQRRAGNTTYQAMQVRQVGSQPSGPLPADVFRTAAMRALPATACLDIDNDTRQVHNRCDVPVWVASYVEVNPVTGADQVGLCAPSPGIVCVIAAGSTLPVITPLHGCVKEVRFSFFSGGQNASMGVWHGDCQSPPGTQAGYGRSCCMFGGGKCGPFVGQPAQPFGLPCMCQYGNPSTQGTVCPP